MTFNIALNFEDGITRFIQCNAGEKVLDAAYRQKVNLPMDCSDGVCGTCKCHCASGEYDLGEDYLDEALSDDEAQARQVLTCQMVPTSDCVIDVPVAAAQCKTALTNTGAQVRQVNFCPIPPSNWWSPSMSRWLSCRGSTSTFRCRARLMSAPTHSARCRVLEGRF
jgi:ferredoxin